MQDKKWVRLGLTVAIVGGALGAVSAVGCSGDDNTGNTGGKDSGTDHSVTPDSSSSSGGDTGTGGDTGSTNDGPSGDGEGGTGAVYAKVYLANAAVDPGAPFFRFCFGIDTSGNGTNVSIAGNIAPFPDSKVSPLAPVAGLPNGFGGSTASSPTLKSFDLATIPIALYALNAFKIGNDTADGGPDGGAELPCEKVIGSDAKGTTGSQGGFLTPGTDYWYVGTIPKGTLAHGTTWVAAVAGCVPGETGAAAALCGTGYDPVKGNLKVIPYQLDNATAIDAGIGAQFAQTSSQWDGVLTTSGAAATAAGFFIPNTAPPPDAGGGEAGSGDGGATDGGTAEAGPPPNPYVYIPITGTASDDGKLHPATLAGVPGVTFDGKSGFFAQGIAADGGTVFVPPGCIPPQCVSPTALPLTVIDQLTYGTWVP
jgi:hypothetical protein